MIAAMRWLLIRHAEKNIEISGNPGLSPRGFEQAEQLALALHQDEKLRPDRLLSSPKRRAQETLQAISRQLHLEVQVIESLDERPSGESFAQFRERLRRFLDELSERTRPDETVALCSHLDWLEEARSLLECADDLTAPRFDHWGTAQTLILERTDKNDPWRIVDFRRLP